ncbi:MAG: acetyl-CoA carboxylase biotin carboxyl carrier protein [Alphaproteobacteria bacterium]|nr:acetyl-CoA carboxylase biotin carboxyl carrier protein [Alphaproteobacteria bacterium]
MPKTSKFDIDIAAIRKLAKLLEETGLSEIEYAQGDSKIRCVARADVMHLAAPVAAPSAIPTPTPAPQTEPPPEQKSSGTAITSPMVGTAYMAPSPGATPFVKVGDKVKEGDTLLIIEAMKVMNPIKATKSGVVGLILVEDAKPVEFGETLLVLE